MTGTSGRSGREEQARIDALPTPLLRRAANPMLMLSGAANVVMQLSRPEIGWAVATSDAPSSLFNDPSRRRRTTVGYLAVATHGTAAERAAFRRGVNQSHAPVRSGPGSAVGYDAMDPEQQWWVAACLYRGLEETCELVHGPADRESLLAEGLVLGGLLQMPAAAWPTSRAAFEATWREGVAAIRIDPEVRDFLLCVIAMRYLPRPPPVALAERRLRLTTGFLPPEFRAEMRLPWTPDDQRWFNRLTTRAAGVVRQLPRGGQEYPFNASIRGVRKRIARGLPPM
ncbi:MAG: oxygenase MpaB family protein [Marmoricola sp.]